MTVIFLASTTFAIFGVVITNNVYIVSAEDNSGRSLVDQISAHGFNHTLKDEGDGCGPKGLAIWCV
jgi:hypothetical protein